SLATPLMVNFSPWAITMSPLASRWPPENTTSVQPIVRIRRNASWDLSPWAEAGEAKARAVPIPNSSIAATAASRFIISSPLPLLHEAADGPDGQHPPDELADPVAGDGHGGPEDECHVLRLAEEASQRAVLDDPQVLGGLAVNERDPLDVGHREDAIHPLGRL